MVFRGSRGWCFLNRELYGLQEPTVRRVLTVATAATIEVPRHGQESTDHGYPYPRTTSVEKSTFYSGFSVLASEFCTTPHPNAAEINKSDTELTNLFQNGKACKKVTLLGYCRDLAFFSTAQKAGRASLKKLCLIGLTGLHRLNPICYACCSGQRSRKGGQVEIRSSKSGNWEMGIGNSKSGTRNQSCSRE